MRQVKRSRSIVLAAAAVSSLVSISSLQAINVTWSNDSGDSLWNTTSLNWWNTTATGQVAWNNAANNTAVFDDNGIIPKTITINDAISLNNLTIQSSTPIGAVDYTMSGTGSLNFGTNSASITVPRTGVSPAFNVGNLVLNVPVYGSNGFNKFGGGTLTLTQPLMTTGQISMFEGGSTLLTADINIGDVTSFGIPGGTLKLPSASILPSTVKVGIGAGYLDIGANAITVKEITFTNHNDGLPWDTTVNATNGVIGSGTLHVTGDINVIGWSTGFPNNYGNTIAANFDLDGKTQMLRIGRGSSIGLNTALMFTGSISNGAIYKTFGYINNAGVSNSDGISLYANNTYTGSTVLNGGNSVATGTNATTSVKLVGASFALQGAGGSVLSAPTISVTAGSSLILDNNAAVGATGSGGPNIPAALNTDRISDTSTMEFKSSGLIYRGLASTASSETLGTLNFSSGHNTIQIVPNNAGGSATVTVAGDMTLAPRATLVVSTSTFGTGNGTNTLGGNAQLKVSGSIPTADATGVLPRMSTGTDFVTYNATTGVTPLATYATDFSTPNTNVAVTAAGTVSTSVAINALKRSNAITTTIDAGKTLTINSGMIINATGSGTIAGSGTVAFGSSPGVLFNTGATTITAAMTGSAGLINALGTSTLTGNMSGLGGKLTLNSGSINLNTNTFAGSIEVQNGTFSPLVSDLPGQGDILLGSPDNDVDGFALAPTLRIAGAPTGTVINRNVIVDNVTKTVGGKQLETGMGCLIQPLSNSTGTQTLAGNITLNTNVNLQGGGGGPGATIFSGQISGTGKFVITNGHAIFSSTSQISNSGGIYIGGGGFSSMVEFLGTTTSSEPILFNGGNTTTVSSVAYPSFLSYVAGGLPTGTLTLALNTGTTAPRIRPVNNSVINNWVDIQSEANVEVGAGITAEWAGTVAGAGTFNKTGAGTLVLSGTDTFTGPANITAGTLALTNTGSVNSASLLINGGVLNVAGTSSTYSTAPGQTIATGSSGGTIVGNFNHDEGKVSPGGDSSIGTLSATGNFDISGGGIIYSTSLATANADRINVTGATAASGSTLISLNIANGITTGAYTILSTSSGVTGSVAGWTVDTSALRPGSSAVPSIVGNNIVLNVVAANRSLNWSGASGAAWDVATSTNWYDQSASAADKFYSMDGVNFGDTYDGVNAPLTTALTLDSVVVPGPVTFNSSLNYGVSGTGAISGPASLTKSGTGNLTLTNNNTFSGGTTITGGTITIGSNGTVLLTATGSGTLTMNGGALAGTCVGLNGSTGTLSVPLQISSGGGTFNFTPNTSAGTLNIASNITGTGDFHLTSAAGTMHFNVRGANTGFNGKLILDSTATARFTSLASTSATTAYELNAGTMCVDTGTLSQVFSLGSLKGAAGSTLRGHLSFNTGTLQTYEIGALNTSTVFAGNVLDGLQGSATVRALSIKKVGNGTLSFTGTNSYTGTTTVAGGVLVLGPTAQSPVLTGGGAILTAGKLIMNYTSTSPKTVIVADLTANAATGFQAGKVRTTLAVDATKAIGWLDDGTSTFQAKYTYKGDFDLDGAVTSLDFNALAGGYGTTTGAIWAQGDANYDGKVNTLDFNFVAGNFGAAPIAAPTLAPTLGAVVPEPTTLGLLGIAGAMMMRRRKH